MKAILTGLAAATLLTIAAPVLAHGGGHPMHGGQVVLVGETAFELVAERGGAALYVVEDGDDVDAVGMTARMTISAGGRSTQVAMRPTGGNHFVARGIAFPKNSQVTVMIVNRRTQARQSAIFTIK